MSARRLWLVAKKDLAFNLTRPLFWFQLIILVLLIWGLAQGNVGIQTGDATVGGKKAWITSEFALAQTMAAFVITLYAFFLAVAAGMPVIRDAETKIDQLLHATPLTPAEYVWGKFGAVLSTYLGMLLLQLLISAAFYYGLPSADMAEQRGPFELVNFLRPALVFGVPPIVFLAGTAFAIGEGTRKPILVFVLPVVVVLFGYFFLWSWSPSWLDWGVNRLLMLVDPAGVRWLTETWTEVDRGAEFYNTAPIDYMVVARSGDFGPAFLLSRLAFVGVGLGAVAWSGRHLARTLTHSGKVPAPDASRGPAPDASRGAGSRGVTVGAETEVAELTGARGQRMDALGMRSGAPRWLEATRRVARAELRELASQPGLYLFVPLILLQAISGALSARGPFEAPILFTSGSLATTMMSFLTSLVVLLVMFYTVESMERERATKLSAIHDALPVRTEAILAGKLIAITAVASVIVLAMFVASVAALLVQHDVVKWPALAGGAILGLVVALGLGVWRRRTARAMGVAGAVAVVGAAVAAVALAPRNHAFAMWPFVLVWGVLTLPTLLVWTAFVMAGYSLTKNRYTAYALSLAALVFFFFRLLTGKTSWVTNWALWRSIRWSDVSVLEIDRTALVLNRLLALALAAFFLWIAVRYFPRRQKDPIGMMNALRPAALSRSLKRAAPVVLLPLLLGAMLWRQVDRGPSGGKTRKALRDYWRANLATWKDAKVPAIAHVDMDLTLEPGRRAYGVRGSYLLVNTTDSSLRLIPVTTSPAWAHLAWTTNGRSATPDSASALRVFSLAEALAPGDSLRLGFSYDGVETGATKNGGGAGEFILPSGVVMTSLESPRYFPVIGYMEEIGVESGKNDYEPRRYPADFYQGVTEPLFGSRTPMTTNIRITTPTDFTANSVGTKVADAVTGGTRTVTWVSDQPVMAFNVVAGRYAVRRGAGTALYYDARHGYNAEEMGRALDAARRYYSEWFGAFPWRELKLTEFPALAGYAQGFPTNISFSEQLGFLTKRDPRANPVFMVTAHESAHQWWGNMLQPGRGPGANVLSEGMAHFSTMLLFEQVKGERDTWEFRKRIESQYGDQRQADAERKLYLVDGSRAGDETLMYDKGGWVVWMLMNRMGREPALRGMKDFIAAYRGQPDHPVLQDFTAFLRRYAPDTASYDDYVRQWFDSVVVPEYNLDSAKTTPAGGEWVTTVRVRNAGTGRMPVDVAVTRGEHYADSAAAAKKKPAPYAVERVSVTLDAKQTRTVTIRSAFKPEKVVVDPDVRVLMLRRKGAEAKL